MNIKLIKMFTFIFYLYVKKYPYNIIQFIKKKTRKKRSNNSIPYISETRLNVSYNIFA